MKRASINGSRCSSPSPPETRTCDYDRAGIGRSAEATGCRDVVDLLDDIEALLAAAGLAGPYVLVGTSGGGYLLAGLAARRAAEVAGLMLVETPKAITVSTLPPEVVEQIACDSPTNIERRDYIAVDHAVWDARSEIGDFPMTIITNDYGPDAPPGDEQTNVADQQGWLVLSPNSKQVAVTSGHDVVGNESALVIDEILAVLAAARDTVGPEAPRREMSALVRGGSWNTRTSSSTMARSVRSTSTGSRSAMATVSRWTRTLWRSHRTPASLATRAS